MCCISVTAFISHYGIACHKRDATQCTNVWDARCAINIALAPHILARARPPGSQRGRPDSVAAGGRACGVLAAGTRDPVPRAHHISVHGARGAQHTAARDDQHPHTRAPSCTPTVLDHVLTRHIESLFNSQALTNNTPTSNPHAPTPHPTCGMNMSFSHTCC